MSEGPRSDRKKKFPVPKVENNLDYKKLKKKLLTYDIGKIAISLYNYT